MRHSRRRHDGRGRHRRADSPETRRWQELERDLDSLLHLKSTDPRLVAPKPPKPGPPPARPAWLDPAEYDALLELRRSL